MSEFKCERCGFLSKYRSNFIRHLKRKFICPPKLKDVNLNSIKTKMGILKKDISDNSKNPIISKKSKKSKTNIVFEEKPIKSIKSIKSIIPKESNENSIISKESNENSIISKESNENPIVSNENPIISKEISKNF